jgi:hypothetical protein
MSTTNGRAASLWLGVVGLLGSLATYAGDKLFDFTQDPATIGIEIKGNGVNTQPWLATGGNPGGFLAITYPIGNSFSAMQFPDIDDGKIVTAFTFEADLRVGNSTGDRAADGFR